MKVLSDHARSTLFGLTAAVGVTVVFTLAIAAGYWIKFGSQGSDFQRLNALEARVERLELEVCE